ncbi:DUF3027 domain-containing protein [Agrococcus citreus]|uniref:DUF3027 domain-containing protein n=1 Tax=Agrococcus citreus TaxID=84643 RepID=A0ABN1YS19_9MICO
MTSTPDPSGSTEPEVVDSAAPTDSAEPAESTRPAELTPESALVSEAPDASEATAQSEGTAESSSTAQQQPKAQPVPATPTPEELELAAAALHDVTPRGSVGHVLDALLEGGEGDQAQVLAIRHISTLPGYPDWTWTVLLSRGVEGGPTVLEVALLPGEGSLLAPAWVPWSERLADYLAAKESAGADGEGDDEDDEELDSDLESDLEDDFDDDFVEDDEDDDESDGWGEVAERDAGPDDSRD